MPLYRKMKSPLGYQNLTNSSFDSYGVDHSGFTTRDELEYQFARQERENLLMDQEQQNGVTDHFTQYGTNFWGTPQENNYGFGSSNISENIERLSKQFMTPPSSSASFLDQSLAEEPQQTGSLFDTPVGYQSLLSDDSSNNFLEESSGYPSSSYNSMVLGTPQSLGHSSVRTPATTSLTGGLNPNAFVSNTNNFSYPNALGTGGGTLTERMAATLKAREMPYNSLSNNLTDSMSELSGNSFNSSQYEPSSSTDESWFNSLFGSKPAFGATLVDFDDVYHTKRDKNGKITYVGTDIHEGGFSNRINDDGGPTNYGVTQNSLNEYNGWKSFLKKGKDFPTLVQLLQPEQAKQIMDEMYYQRYGINKLNNLKIAQMVFEEQINQGTVATTHLAESTNELKNKNFQDKIIISQELADMINSLTEDESIKLNDLIAQKRMERYFNRVDKVPKNINNLKGWYNRLKMYYSDPALFEQKYKKRVDEYLYFKYPQFYNKK